MPTTPPPPPPTACLTERGAVHEDIRSREYCNAPATLTAEQVNTIEFTLRTADMLLRGRGNRMLAHRMGIHDLIGCSMSYLSRPAQPWKPNPHMAEVCPDSAGDRGWHVEDDGEPAPDGKPYYLRRHDVWLFGHRCHIRAVRVTDDEDGTQVGVHDPYHILDDLYNFDDPGDAYEPHKIEGYEGEWIITVVPACR